jgi:hypothetical protein
VALVENFRDEGPMKIGLGKDSHVASLYAFGAERVFRHPEETALLIEYSGVRAGDVVIVVLPASLPVTTYKRIIEACGGDVMFQVAGHEPASIASDNEIDAFRKLKPKGNDTEVIQATGRPAKITYTLEQAEAILRLWYDTPRRKPGAVKELAEAMLGLDAGFLSDQWVKDLAIKFTGTAKRTKPDGWDGLTDTTEE